MNNQTHWNESFEGLASNQADPQHDPEFLHSASLHLEAEEEIQRENNASMHLEALQTISQPILESSRQGGNGSWQEGESSRQQQQQSFSRQQEVRGQQTYFTFGPHEREAIRVTTVSPIPHNQVTLAFPPQQTHLSPQIKQVNPRYPPRMSHPPPQKPTQFKSLDNLRNVTQQSFAPTQKTIVLNHINTQMGGVYNSHVSTERMPIQSQRELNTRHSHVHDTRVGSPSRISFDYGQIKPEINGNLFSSYIPTTAPPAITQRGVATISSNAPQASERHEHHEEVNFWREKYEELGRRWQSTRIKEGKQQEVALNKFTALEKNYQILQNSYDKIVQDYHAKLDQNQRYFEQIHQLQATINQLQVTTKREQNMQGLQKALQQKSMLVGLLRKENQQLQTLLQEMEQRHEQEMREMQEHATMLQMEFQQRESQLRQRSQMKTSNIRKSDHSQFDRSRMESFQNTRVMQLEMHVGKLNAELGMREESFERHLKMANLNVTELVQKLKSQAKQKDQNIYNLQEKAGLLESDLNKKESIIRNLRDQISKAANSAQPTAHMYSSAVNPAENRLGEHEQVFKRQLQNMRRNLFQRQREKLIIKQKYEQLQQRVIQTEQALGRRKVQNQEMRRQLNDFDNLQHQNQKLMQVLNKKNAQLLELKEMLMEKEQHAGDFENLSKENERLRAFMLKKNEELSDLAEKLYNQEKKARELQLTHTPHINQLEEELQRLSDMLERKDIQISKLNQSLELVQGNFSEIQFELQRHKNINNEYQAQIKDNMMKMQAYQDHLAAMQGEKHLMQSQLQVLTDKINHINQELAHRQHAETTVIRSLRQVEAELKMRQEQLQNFATQQIELRQFKQKSSKQIQQFQSKQGDLQSRCRDLQSILRNREQRLARAQKELEEGRQQLKRHQSCSRQIQQMTQKISHYQMRIISLTLKRSHSGLVDYPPPSEIFQNKLIYNLKRENQTLKMQLGQLESAKGLTNNRNQPISQKRLTKGTEIKVRLDQFNQNLQNAIGETMKRVRSLDALQPIAFEDQTKQIERLKKLTQQMQRQQLEESFSAKKTFSTEQLQQLYQEQLIFYRNTNSELQKRVDELLRLNKELKQQIEETSLNRGSSWKTFYEEEIRRLERQVSLLQADKVKYGQTTRKLQKRGRQLEEELSRMLRRESSELSYNFQLNRPNNKAFD